MAAPRLLDQLRNAIRVRHRSSNTESAYVHYVRDFVLFQKKRTPTAGELASVRLCVGSMA